MADEINSFLEENTKEGKMFLKFKSNELEKQLIEIKIKYEGEMLLKNKNERDFMEKINSLNKEIENNKQFPSKIQGYYLFNILN